MVARQIFKNQTLYALCDWWVYIFSSFALECGSSEHLLFWLYIESFGFGPSKLLLKGGILKEQRYELKSQQGCMKYCHQQNFISKEFAVEAFSMLTEINKLHYQYFSILSK